MGKQNQMNDPNKEDALRWRSPTPADVTHKPGPTAIKGWFLATFDGRCVWTNGHIVDLAGEPHLTRWKDHTDPKRIGAGIKPPPVEPLLSQVDGSCVFDLLEPMAAYTVNRGSWGTHKDSIRGAGCVLHYGSPDTIAAFQGRYIRYFASKHKGAQLLLRPQTEPPHAWQVHADGVCVGIIAPLGKAEDMRSTLPDHAALLDRLAAAERARQKTQQ